MPFLISLNWYKALIYTVWSCHKYFDWSILPRKIILTGQYQFYSASRNDVFKGYDESL